MSKIHLNNQDKINEAITKLASIEPNGSYSVEIKKLPKIRSSQQNKALHVFKNLVSKELNDRGLSIQKVLVKKSVEIDWNGDLVLELLWRTLQVAITGKKSTTEPTREEYIKIYDTINRHLSYNFGVHVPWPVKEDKK